ncbi:MAG: DUF1127 domain-containing protein [Hyphomicrobiaceae bacterium]
MANAIHHLDGTVCTCRRDIAVAWSPARFATNAARAIRLSEQRRAQRRRLLELDDRLLADIGITRQTALHEASK